MDQVKIFAPASVANVSCGFDVLGFCLEPVGDEMIIRKTESSGLKITKIVGQSLPLDVKKNVAGSAAEAMLKAHPQKAGFEIEIYKNIKAGSGIGSSAASAAGAWSLGLQAAEEAGASIGCGAQARGDSVR